MPLGSDWCALSGADAQIRGFLISLQRENAAIEELARNMLQKMDDEIAEEEAAAELSAKIAKRFPNGAAPEDVRHVGPLLVFSRRVSLSSAYGGPKQVADFLRSLTSNKRTKGADRAPDPDILDFVNMGFSSSKAAFMAPLRPSSAAASGEVAIQYPDIPVVPQSDDDSSSDELLGELLGHSFQDEPVRNFGLHSARPVSAGTQDSSGSGRDSGIGGGSGAAAHLDGGDRASLVTEGSTPAAPAIVPSLPPSRARKPKSSAQPDKTKQDTAAVGRSGTPSGVVGLVAFFAGDSVENRLQGSTLSSALQSDRPESEPAGTAVMVPQLPVPGGRTSPSSSSLDKKRTKHKHDQAAGGASSAPGVGGRTVTGVGQPAETVGAGLVPTMLSDSLDSGATQSKSPEAAPGGVGSTETAASLARATLKAKKEALENAAAAAAAAAARASAAAAAIMIDEEEPVKARRCL